MLLVVGTVLTSLNIDGVIDMKWRTVFIPFFIALAPMMPLYGYCIMLLTEPKGAELLLLYRCSGRTER